MAKVTIKDNSAMVKALTDALATQSMEQLAGMVENNAKDIVPVDTGALRGSIQHETQEKSGGVESVIGTNKEYAEYVELGTSKMRAQPYLKPAAEKIKGQIAGVFKSNFAKMK